MADSDASPGRLRHHAILSGFRPTCHRVRSAVASYQWLGNQGSTNSQAKSNISEYLKNQLTSLEGHVYVCVCECVCAVRWAEGSIVEREKIEAYCLRIWLFSPRTSEYIYNFMDSHFHSKQTGIHFFWYSYGTITTTSGMGWVIA